MTIRDYLDSLRERRRYAALTGSPGAGQVWPIEYRGGRWVSVIRPSRAAVRQMRFHDDTAARDRREMAEESRWVNIHNERY